MNERTQTMARLYVEEGLTYQQIAERYGITRQRVHFLLGKLDLAKHRGARQRVERTQTLKDAHARITEGTSSVREEAERLGYSSPDSFRSMIWRMGLHVPRQAVEAPHGTRQRYSRGCHCGECKEANRQYMQSLKGKEAPNHGTVSGYENYECRCQACKEAAREDRRVRKAQERQKKEVET